MPVKAKKRSGQKVCFLYAYDCSPVTKNTLISLSIKNWSTGQTVLTSMCYATPAIVLVAH